ncbi:hypothetical protein ACFQJC_17910 [Haloferax namakaokahaiae]|uniref:Helix-hairpin-helix domain-containing protein n=1 Tax=Haloferax namakaokahaiae TaxID=1748331 RepID=A0ABD5ZK72_9EURY
MTHDSDSQPDGVGGGPGSDDLDWLPERISLPSDEWVIYPPGEPRPANFALRFEKSVPTALVGTESGDSPGVHVLPHPGGLSVSARLGGLLDESIREFQPPTAETDRVEIASWVQTWVETLDDRTELERIRSACRPVPNAGDTVARALFDHFDRADLVAAHILDRDTRALCAVSGIAEQTAEELVVHYGTDTEWDYYRSRQSGSRESLDD